MQIQQEAYGNINKHLYKKNNKINIIKIVFNI